MSKSYWMTDERLNDLMSQPVPEHYLATWNQKYGLALDSSLTFGELLRMIYSNRLPRARFDK